MSSEMRVLVRKAEALAVCVMAVDSYSRDELRVFAENFRDEARALLAQTQVGACRSDDERAAVEFYALNPSAVKISDEMIERARLAYAAAIPGMFVNRTDDEPMFVEAWRAALEAALGDMVLVPGAAP